MYYDPFHAPGGRLRKRIKAMIRAMEGLQSDVDETKKEIETLSTSMEMLQFPLPLHEYDRAQIVVQSAREIFCEELAKQIGDRHAQLIEQYQRLDAKTDLTKPHEWFSYARLDRRKVSTTGDNQLPVRVGTRCHSYRSLISYFALSLSSLVSMSNP